MGAYNELSSERIIERRRYIPVEPGYLPLK
jgi:hypothetical protein